MKRLLFSWIVSKDIIENIAEQHRINNYEPIEEPEVKEEIIYEYWSAFDNDIPTLEIAYNLYEENRVCHILKDGICKCYFEFNGDEGYIKNDPKKFSKII
jgi:hypothetical protein